MKNIFVLLTALMIMGTMAAPRGQTQNMAKLESLERELEQMEQAIERQGGQPTPEQARRMVEIQQEIYQAMGTWGGLIQQIPQQSPRQDQNTDQTTRQMQQQM
jgi:hypothetical protein